MAKKRINRAELETGYTKESVEILNSNLTEKDNEKKENRDIFNKKKCKVIYYNKHSKTIAFDFDGVNIQIEPVNHVKIHNGYVGVKYKGKINTPDFKITI